MKNINSNLIPNSIFSAIIFLLTISLTPIAQATELQIRTTKNSITYLTGGIGDEEAREMRSYAKKFTLNLLFSEGKAGQSVTAINVNIYNEKSELVFRIKGAKPVLYVNLPTGSYTILATNNGEKLRHKLTIAENTNQKVILNWKDIEGDLLNNEVSE